MYYLRCYRSGGPHNGYGDLGLHSERVVFDYTQEAKDLTNFSTYFYSLLFQLGCDIYQVKFLNNVNIYNNKDYIYDC